MVKHRKRGAEMCTNYRAPSEPEGLSELKLPALRDLWRRTPWDPEVYPDYLAPIVAMVAINVGDDPVMSRMYKPGDEKRSVVILSPDDWGEWLSASNIDAARAMLQLYPADEIVAVPK